MYILLIIHYIIYMSYLIRTGNSRNNIKWGGGKSTKAKYLRRTGTSRNSISWIDINSNGTYNVLERTSTGRNNIRWYNTQFSFISTRTVSELICNYSGTVIVYFQIRMPNNNGYYYYGSDWSPKITTNSNYSGMIVYPSDNSYRELTRGGIDTGEQTMIKVTFRDDIDTAANLNSMLNNFSKIRFVQMTEWDVVTDNTASFTHNVGPNGALDYRDEVRIFFPDIRAPQIWSSVAGRFFFGFTN